MQKIRQIATASIVATAAALCIGAGTAEAATPVHSLVPTQGTAAGATSGTPAGGSSTGGVGDLLGGVGSLLGGILGLLGL
jgi:hypothetical protein